MGAEGFGARVLRKEDRRFITGRGQYTDDIEAARVAVGAGAPRIDRVRHYFDHPGFVEPFRDEVRRAEGLNRIGEGGGIVSSNYKCSITANDLGFEGQLQIIAVWSTRAMPAKDGKTIDGNSRIHNFLAGKFNRRTTPVVGAIRGNIYDAPKSPNIIGFDEVLSEQQCRANGVVTARFSRVTQQFFRKILRGFLAVDDTPSHHDIL